jgi:dihydroxyacetone kinase
MKRITPAACAGVLVIVKNYGGDRLNFGLAAETVGAQGVKVKMVIAGDDCALEGSGPTGRVSTRPSCCQLQAQ